LKEAASETQAIILRAKATLNVQLRWYYIIVFVPMSLDEGSDI
jgi:hypothetical protein